MVEAREQLRPLDTRLGRTELLTKFPRNLSLEVHSLPALAFDHSIILCLFCQPLNCCHRQESPADATTSRIIASQRHKSKVFHEIKFLSCHFGVGGGCLSLALVAVRRSPVAIGAASRRAHVLNGGRRSNNNSDWPS